MLVILSTRTWSDGGNQILIDLMGLVRRYQSLGALLLNPGTSATVDSLVANQTHYLVLLNATLTDISCSAVALLREMLQDRYHMSAKYCVSANLFLPLPLLRCVQV